MTDLPAVLEADNDGAGSGLREQQLVRMDGTVLVSLVVPPGAGVYWVPNPGMDIVGPCAGRVRALPDGPWLVLAYFPEGWPGPQGPWPEDGAIGGTRPMLGER